MKDYGLIGKNLKHTISPFIHKELFALSGFNYSYDVYDINEQELEKNSEIYTLKGFNVTIPYKNTILKYLDETDDKVALYGAVNTVKRENGILKGYNTDGYGFVKGLSKICNRNIESALILGAGGAAGVVAAELALSETDITFAVRSTSVNKARDISNRLKNFNLKECLIQDINEVKGKYDLIVNCTPVGTYPDTNGIPVSEDVVLNSEYVYDLVYNPKTTDLVKLARDNGIKASTGLVMLVSQAAMSQNIWLGSEFNDEQIESLTRKANEFLEEKFQ